MRPDLRERGNKMRHLTVFCFCICAGLCWNALAELFDSAWIKGVTDGCPVSYRTGDPIRFALTLQNADGVIPNGKYFLEWHRTGDDGLVENGKEPLSTKPFLYATKLLKPGFVRLYAVVVDEKGERMTRTLDGRQGFVFFDGGAGADIEALESHPEPVDFDAFWRRQFSRLDLVPVKAERRKVAQGNGKIDVFAVSVDCAGLRPVTGYLSIPKSAASGNRFGCTLKLRGYDGDNFNQVLMKDFPTDRVFFHMNAHGLKLPEFGATEADRKALRWECRSNGCQYALDKKQNEDPEIAYFNGMILRVKRALQYLKSLPEWNGRDLRAEGGSQGGLQAIWAGACGEGVTSVSSEITWCCDIYTNDGRMKKVPVMHRDGWGDGWGVSWTESMGYYDAVNFAKRIPQSCCLEVPRAGLGDYCCPPMGLAKLWNGVKCPATITWVQGSEHGYVPPFYEGRDFCMRRDAR